MLLSPPEWARLTAGLSTLSEAERAEVEAGFDDMEDRAGAGAPLTCPVLDPDAGTCRLYVYRPLVCRTYGYYATRDGGFWCDLVEARVQAGDTGGVVLGRHEAITRAAARDLGEPVTWRQWREAVGFDPDLPR